MASPARRSIRHPHQNYTGATPTSPNSVITNSRRQSKAHVTVEYHRPSRESVQEYHDLLQDAEVHSAVAATWTPNYEELVPVRAAPPPPPSSNRAKTPTQRNSTLTKPRPRSRSQPQQLDPFAANPPGTGTIVAPPRPSRANTATLNDMYTSPPPPQPFSPVEGLPEAYDLASVDPSTSTPTAGSRSRPTTGTKNKKGFLGSMIPEFLHAPKKPEISTPYDPVHLTHVGFNSSTGEFTGLPKEWQQLLQESGISRSEQEKNPQAVMEIVKFYQEGRGDVWDKMGAVSGAEPSIPQPSAFQNPVS